MERKIKLFYNTLLALFIFSTTLLAQTGVGKLAGKVLDAETKEPLIGANVFIVGTDRGAATDLDGNYFVLNIIPGTYDIRVSYVGYGSQLIKEVRIVAGLTYSLDIELSSDFQIETVIITGKKFFEEKATNTVKVIDAEDIGRLPVKGVENLASLQAGVVIAEGSGGADGNATINVRGGRGNEVLYIIDGVPQNDPFFGGNSAQVSNSAIDQLSFQIGGYEAKYGQAQSGIINVTTKSGQSTYSVFGDVVTSSFTDVYGYNLYTMNLSGPIIPGNQNHTIFLSGERGWFLDADPKAISVEVPSVGLSSEILPNNSSSLWRYSARTFHNFNPFALRLGANINTRDARSYIHSYVKNNSEHNPRFKRANYSFSARLSHNLSARSFWNLNVGYRILNDESGDGLWFDNIEAYGDTLANTGFLAPGVRLVQGSRVGLDNVGLFFHRGRVSNSYTKTDNRTLNVDLDFTTQMGKSLLEVGGGFSYNVLRYFSLAPAAIAIDMRGPNAKSVEYRVAVRQPYFFGFDVTGKNHANDDVMRVFSEYNDNNDYQVAAAPKNPLIAYAYFQNRYELSDLVINFGLRMDYFDSKADVLKSEEFPFFGGTDPNDFDAGDFVVKEPEFYLSPRIGIGFPVTASTVFHAQYGTFIQQPTLNLIYTSINVLNNLVSDANFGLNTGNVNSEVTTQYEIGFRQILGDNLGSLNLTTFYKNTKGLVNDETRFFQRSPGSPIDRYYGPANSDFGTIKGLALSLSLQRISFFSFNVDYTYSLAEGTGSSTSSSTTAAFRNTNGETPKVIAPLDFDQRHTGVVNVDFFVPKDNLGVFENTSVNLIFSFNSGRPYTPLQMQNITPGGGSNLGETKGYVNSAFGPGSNRLDLKIEKGFRIGDNLALTPYIWVENLLNTVNAVNVYRTTGNPFTSGYLNTQEGRAVAAGNVGYTEDYLALERDPFNFGIPRLIKLGFKVNFSGLSL